MSHKTLVIFLCYTLFSKSRSVGKVGLEGPKGSLGLKRRLSLRHSHFFLFFKLRRRRKRLHLEKVPNCRQKFPCKCTETLFFFFLKEQSVAMASEVEKNWHSL